MSRLMQLVTATLVIAICSAGPAQEKAKPAAKGATPRRQIPYSSLEKAIPPEMLSQLREKARDIDIGTPSAAGVTDMETVLKWLKEMEYKAEIPAGAGYVQLPEQWIFVEFSEDREQLLIGHPIAEIKDTSTATPDRMLGLMQYSNGVTYFYYNAQNQTMGCSTWMDAKLATKAGLKRRVDAIIKADALTQRFWSLLK